MKKFIALAISLILLISCKQNEQTSNKYIDINGIIDEQLSFLSQHKVLIMKKASMDSLKDQTTFQPDSLTLSNELEIFRSIDVVNKPIYSDIYVETQGIKDTHSNLTVRVLTAKKEAPIRELKIYYQDEPDKLRKIEAVINEQNLLYFTRRKLILQFDVFQDRWLISNYSIAGVQKMVLQDSVRFAISATITFE